MALRDAHRSVEWLAGTNHRLEAELAVYRDAVSHRLAAHLQVGARRLLPAGTRRGRAARTAVRAIVVGLESGPAGLARAARRRSRGRSAAMRALAEASDSVTEDDRHYAEWLARTEPDASELHRLRQESRRWVDAPLVSVVMPVYDSDPSWLDAAVMSVIDQSYERWELCVADDASTRPEVRTRLEHWRSADSRIRLVVRAENGGIAAATNSALALATGDLVAFLDHDDVLRPHALHRVVAFLAANPDHDIVYTDEDHLRHDGVRVDPYLKSAYSPDLLLANNYMCHFLVARRSLVAEAGGLRLGYEGSQDHDLVLRLSERGVVGHVAEVLYSWRQVPGSTAVRADAKSYAWEAGRHAVEDALERRGLAGRVEKGVAPGWYTVRYAVRGQPLVTVIIPTRDRLDLLRACIESVATRTEWPNWRLVVVDNGSAEEETLEYLAGLSHTVVRDPDYFNYSRLVNRGAAAATGDHLLILNNDVEVITPEWMTAMLEQSQRPDVGAVGARLLYPDGRPQHEGIRVGRGIIAGNIDHCGYYNLGLSIRDVSALTGACMMMRRDVFEEVGGFDERLRVAFNDVDLCLRIRGAGYRLVYQPLAQLSHAESASRGKLHPMADERLLVSLWGGPDEMSDPFVSPHIRSYRPFRLR